MSNPGWLVDLTWSATGEGLVVLEGDQIVRANPQMIAWFGDDVVGREIQDLAPLDDSTWRSLISGEADLAAGRTGRGEVEIVYEVRVASDDAGRCVAVFRDVSRERALAIELASRTQALEDSLNGYDIVGDDGRIVYANRAYVEMWGYDHVDEVIGMSAAEHCADPETPGQLMEAMMRDGHVTMEFEARRKDGSTFDVLMSAQRSVGADGRLRFVGTSLDISELRRLRRELAHAAKMEAVGRLAAGVAHDFNNMLSPILGHADLLLDDASLAADHRDAISQIRAAARRARSITSHLLSISRRKPLSPRPTDLNEAVDELESLLRHVVREDVKLEIRKSAHPCRVMVDPAQLQQVLMNLFHNAVDAMPDGGKVTIAVGARDIDVASGHTHTEVDPGDYGEIVVTDTGTGMDRETLARVFDAFFTTKGARGHGLGLASVQGIVKQHGGNVFAYSELGRGSTFKIYLPLTDQPARPEVSDAKGLPKTAGGHVMVVEDDDLVGKVAVQILRSGGLETSDAASGAAALELMAERGSPDLLLSDVLLGDMNGRELVAQAEAKHGSFPVVFMSGYTEDVILHQGVLDEDVDLVEKPFSARELLLRVKARL